jgi:hypothetical protein
MQAPRSPAQLYSLAAGGVLLAFGVVTLVAGHDDFGAGTDLAGSEFILWMANGWDAIVWIGLGALGVVAAARPEAAVLYATAAGAFLVLAAVWGFVDGNDVFGVMAVDTTDNISHAVLGAAGLLAALSPGALRRTAESEGYRGGRATHV